MIDISLTETEYHEDFKRCSECKSSTFRIESHHVLRKGSHRILETQEYIVCTECGHKEERNTQ